MTRPPAVPLPPEPIVGPGELKNSPFYWPNLIAALAASIAIAIGSIGPWIAFMGMSRNNIGSGADGTITLVLGIVATLVLFALLNFGRTQVRVGRMAGLGTVAGIAGVIAFLIALIDAQEVSSRKAEIFGTTIGPEIGWGLWMILIAGPVLAITSAIVVKQVKKIAKATAVPGVPAAPSPTAVAKPVVPPPPPPPPPAPAPVVETKPAPVSSSPPPPPAPTPAPPPVPAPLAAVPAEPPPPPAAPAKPPTPPLPPPPVTVATQPPKAPREGRSGIRRAAPWAGGAAALAAALAAGVWAGPHLTGANRSNTAEPSAVATSASTTPSSAAPSTTRPPTSTTSATPSTASDSSPSAAPATFGPFTSGGDAKVTVGGQPREVRGDISCLVYSGKTNISIGPIGNPVGAAITDADSRVSSVTLGTVDDVMLAYLDGAADGNATATRDGKSYRITGTASGFDPKNPMQPYTRPFEINVTCP